MPKLLHLKLISWILLVAVLTVTIHGVCEGAHAVQDRAPALGEQGALSQLSGSDHCPCGPVEHEGDFDACDTCVNCICHASMTVEPFRLSYNPVFSDLKSSESFKPLPEVHLSKFIPPRNLI